MLASWGIDIDPRRLNIHLRDNGGYKRSNLLIWAALEELGAKLTGYVNCVNTPAPIDELKSNLRAGRGVIALVDFHPGRLISGHWVCLHSLATHSGHISDPWQLPGYELISIRQYLLKSWDTQRGIFAAAIYERSEPASHTEQTDVTAIGGLRTRKEWTYS